MRFDEAMALLAAFEREGVKYVLVGSMAMAAQGVVRATRYIDFFIATDDDNVDRIKRALHTVFADDSIDDINAADLRGSYPVIQYGPPDADYVIDFLARLGETFSFRVHRSRAGGDPAAVRTPARATRRFRSRRRQARSTGDARRR
jgi:hypothetical protein